MQERYNEWKKQAARTFDLFKNNTEFEEVLNRLEELEIAPSTNDAKYYYYSEDRSIVDTRRLLYYRNYGLFKMLFYYDGHNKRANINIELIRKAEDYKKRIQDIPVLFKDVEVQVLFDKRTFNVFDKDELNKFFELLKKITTSIKQYQLNITDQPLKLTSIKVYNFKNIRQATLTFDKHFQLLVGSNNAGKTSFIQGILLAFRGLDKLYNQNKINFDEYNFFDETKRIEGVRIDDIPFVVQNYRELFNVDVKTQEFNKGVKFARFEFVGGQYIELEMYSVGENISIRISDSARLLRKEKIKEFLSRSISLIPSFFNITINEERKTKRRYASLMRSGNYNQLFRNILLDLKDDIRENEENNNGTIVKVDDKFEILRKNLQDIFDVYDLNVKFHEEIDEYIQATHIIKGKEYDISNLGMGTLQFIQVVAQALNGDPFLILLDEPDAHLNTNLQVKVIEFFKKLSEEYNIYLLIATHSNDIISCAQTDQIMRITMGETKRIEEINEFQAMINEIGSTNEDIKEMLSGKITKTLIITEGKTDWKHLKGALIRLQEDGEFNEINISFLEYENDIEMGGDNLVSICRQYSKTIRDNKIICIFDRDDRGTISKLGGLGDSYKAWGNNVFSVILPVPKHRESTPEISIEHYYTDEDIKIKDDSGRRLYFGNEFSQRSGLHLSEELFCMKKDKCGVNSISIIDSQVYNKNNEEVNVALTKNDFADKILNNNNLFRSVEYKNFREVYNIIQEIEEL